MDKKTILANYDRNLSAEGPNRIQYLKYAQEFIDYFNGELTRENVVKFMDKLRRRKLSDGTLNFRFRQIATIFKRNKIDWDFRRGEAPTIRENRIIAPALHPDLVAEAILATRKNGTPFEIAMLALSTTYGLRRIEMINLKNSDISVAKRWIYIATAKHGRDRTHLVPDEIVPALLAYDFDEQRTESMMYQAWHRIEYWTGINHTARVNWHSIRRTLDTMLLKDFSNTTVGSFLRWKRGTSSDMTVRYSQISFVGRDGTSKEVTGEAYETDKEIFSKHPFLIYWQEEI